MVAKGTGAHSSSSRYAMALKRRWASVADESRHTARVEQHKHVLGRAGAHVFRHNLATRMIRCGASLTEIAQVLRHRALAATQLYVKVEFEALSDVALPWPTTEVQL
jgi:site-specific recombinase XerD